MADDLDELLDEVESKFCCGSFATGPPFSGRESDGERPSEGSRSSRGGHGTDRAKEASPGEGADAGDIDALLEDILDDDDCTSFNLAVPREAKKDYKSSLLPSTSKKCCPAFLAGTLVAYGVGTRTSQRACDRLRCTSCDFRVTVFDDCEWDLSCDYLFFRNNMPSGEKLRAKLRRRQGARAYACQCSWRSVLQPCDLVLQPQLKWVCGKHEA